MRALMAIGIAAGSAGALAATRVMAGVLHEVRPTDAAALAGAAVVLGVLAVLASLAPAWNATRIDPIIVLRGE